MPSEWKFEISSSKNIENNLILLEAVFIKSERILDVYFGSAPDTTLKLRVYPDGETKVISFNRNESGSVSNIQSTKHESFERALVTISPKSNEKLRLQKEVQTYKYKDTIITLHTFSDGRKFMCVEGGTTKNVYSILNTFGINHTDNVGKSFDDIFLSN